jgi:hypothetical protein
VRAGRAAGWTALVAALLIAAGVLLPIPPQFLAIPLDRAFGATLHFGAARGYGVGTRLISAFGPLGFVFYPQYDPDTFFWLLALRSVLAVATCWALAWIGYAAWGSPWGAAVALFTCAPFLAPPDVWFLTLPALAVLVDLPAGRAPPAALRLSLGAAIGLASLIKFTVMLAALAVLVPLTAGALRTRRRAALAGGAAVLAAAAAWLATGQTGDCLHYLDWSLRDTAAAYASAMQLPTDPWLTLHAAAVSAAVFVAGALLVRRRLRTGRWAAYLALAGILCLVFKAGFVRADVHAFITSFGLLVVAVLLALLWSRRPLELAPGALLVALLPGGLWAHTVAVHGPPIMYFPPRWPAEAIRHLAAAPLVFGGDALARAQARNAAEIRAANPLPALRGPVDVYSYDQAVLLAYGFDFRPRPVFQSYMAYSPRLARANADFLVGDGAPEWILFRVSPIDRKLPALDDAPSWPLFMARYRSVGPAGAFALLQRRETPLPWRLEPLARVETQTGSPVAVPATSPGAIWARIDLHQTRRDELVGMLLAAPLVYIDIGLSDGAMREYRLVPALARDGFLLSPVVEDTAGFMRLLSSQSDAGRADDATAIAMRLAAAPGIAPGARPLTVEFFRLVIGDTGGIAGPPQ